MHQRYLSSVVRQLEYYKQTAEKAIAQVSDEQLFWQYNAESNSIATIIKHLWGNMCSRWTDFLTTDGEKPWRERDAEFENEVLSREALLQKWEEGWQTCFSALHALQAGDLEKTIYIRNQPQSAMDAINRQLAHYPYHIGQIVFIAKLCATQWTSLSIPRGGSEQFNAEKFGGGKQ